MTVSINDLDRLCAEINFKDMDDMENALAVWCSDNDIEIDAMKTWLRISFDMFIAMAQSDHPNSVGIAHYTSVGQSFRMGWEAHKQYGNAR